MLLCFCCLLFRLMLAPESGLEGRGSLALLLLARLVGRLLMECACAQLNVTCVYNTFSEVQKL